MKTLAFLLLIGTTGCAYNHTVEVSAKTACAEISVRYSLYHEPTQSALASNGTTGFAENRP